VGWEAGERRQGLPLDPALPAFDAIERDGVDATLRALGLPPPFEEIGVLKHHAGSRCTFALRAGGRRLVAKAFRGADVSELVALLRALERHGLAGPLPPTAPRVIAFDPALRLVVIERLDGPSSTALIARGGHGGRLAADWLRRQWAAPIRLGRPYGPAEFLARVERNCAPIVAVSPRLGSAAKELLGALRDRPPPEGETVLVHGSFSVSHVLDLGAGAGVIDWDGFAQGPPELDAATFLASLARTGDHRPTLARAAARAAAAFRGGIALDVDPAALAWYEAGARIRSARHLCVHRPAGWTARAERLLPASRPRAGAGAGSPG
jgi:hypothetical protein